MNLGQLIVLGVLATDGPSHGHSIRRRARQTDVDRWAGVTPGALHRELQKLAEAGCVKPVREEQEGRRPVRTIFAITAPGRQRLAALRDEALRQVVVHPDAVGVALLFGGEPDPRKVAASLAHRRDTIAAMQTRLSREYDGFAAQLPPPARAVFRRGLIALRAELAWHREADGLLRGRKGGPP